MGIYIARQINLKSTATENLDEELPFCIEEPPQEVSLCYSCSQYHASVTTIQCGHPWCLECLTNQVKACIEPSESTKLRDICCPGESPVTGSRVIRRILPPELSGRYKNYMQKLYTQMKIANHEAMPCIDSDCSGLVLLFENSSTLKCKKCHTEVCPDCFKWKHTDSSCEEAASYAANSVELPFIRESISLQCAQCCRKSEVTVTESCGHTFCIRCVEHVLSQCRGNPHQNYYWVFCIYGCPVKRSKTFFSMFSPGDYSLYKKQKRLQFLQNQMCLHAARVAVCPEPECKGHVIMRVGRASYQCLDCNRKVCPQCMQLSHPGECCDARIEGGDLLPFSFEDPAPMYHLCIICNQITLSTVADSCGHRICGNCMQNHLNSCFESIQYGAHNWNKCAYGCEIKRSKSFYKQFDAQIYKQLVEVKRMAYIRGRILKNEGVVCPVPDCWGFAPLLNQAELTTCQKCRSQICTSCIRKVHTGRTCEEAAIDTGEAKLAELAQENYWRACPLCKTYIEKTEGCDHMTCFSLLCQGVTEFCFCCGSYELHD